MSSHSNSSPTPKDLLHDLQNLVSDAEKMITDTVTENHAEAVEALRARFDAAQTRLVELGANAKKQVVAGARHADESIRANPYQAIAIAAGVGLLMGIALGRGSK